MIDAGGKQGPRSGVEQQVWEALSRVIDPEIHRPITELDMVGRISVNERRTAEVGLKLTIAGCPAARRIEPDAREATLSAPRVAEARPDVAVIQARDRRALIHGVPRPGSPL